MRSLYPAMGCTEPIAVAYAGALARQTLGTLPERIELTVSGNIIKNVKSVIVPHTGGRKGLPVAVAAGVRVGDADAQLEVLANVTEDQLPLLDEYLSAAEITVSKSPLRCPFDIQVRVFAGGDTAFVQIVGSHTNVVRIEKNGEVLLNKPFSEEAAQPPESRRSLTVEDIIAFADEVDLDDVRALIARQIEYNTAIAEAGLTGQYGAAIGKILLDSYGDSVQNRAKAWAAAGSDARMNGCEKPVVINSGSGNQGMTASLPVIVYARELRASEEQLYRALVVSNLVTIHLKTGIGSLSAYCGATSAAQGPGPASAICTAGAMMRSPTRSSTRSPSTPGCSVTARRRPARRRSPRRSRRGCSACDVPARQPVLRRRRHRRQGRGEHHPRRQQHRARRHARDRQRDHPPDDRGGNCQMKILVTGFTPFGGEQINPSWEAVRRLPNRIGRAELIKHEIPTEFDASGAALHKLLTELRPDAVLCVGQYGGANCIRVERVAINLRDARIADNAGKQPTDEPVVAGGPDAYFATIPTREIVDALREQGIPAQLSYSAGTFVCNNLLYCALHESERSNPAPRCGFVHVPYLPEQTKDGSAPSMGLEMMVKALHIAVEAIAEEEKQ